MTVASGKHLVDEDVRPCAIPGCGQSGSSRMRCRKCGAIIWRCGGHNKDIQREAQEHCK